MKRSELKEMLREVIIEEMQKLNESFKEYKFNSHKTHNPQADILEGHTDKLFITYGIYVKDTSKYKKGDEFMEFYTGENYGKPGKSYSRMYPAEKIPSKFKKYWLELKNLYEKKYKK